jgi:uncharacterized RmlC-like cupin family protein
MREGLDQNKPHVTHVAPLVSDERGTISVLDTEKLIRRLVVVHSTKGSCRGNHWHKKQGHFVYLLDGELGFRFIWGGATHEETLLPGDLAWVPPRVPHTFFAKKDSTALEFSRYTHSEADSVRVPPIGSP